ncbi:hypothetical protein [Roseibium algicola]|uniref:hypothetical protein n=1 Tax=Roseibium algicola TaxID=2857014 RepID=UPI0012EB49BD|nr:hypothetical protein [Roseibium aggregatum]
MADRYQVRNCSVSAHCCFEATVVDTHIPELNGDGKHMDLGHDYGPEYRSICETFSVEDAEIVASALNLLAEHKELDK